MKISSILFFILFSAIALPLSSAEEYYVRRTAAISSCDDGTLIKQSGEKSWSPAKPDMILKEGDSVRTGSKAGAILNINGIAQSATLKLMENSEIALSILSEDKKDGTQITLLDLSMGEAVVTVKELRSKKSKFEIKTPTSIIDASGAKFSVSIKVEE